MSWARGDRCVVDRHLHGKVARIMAVADGYAMLRYPGCSPFVESLKEIQPPLEVPTEEPQ